MATKWRASLEDLWRVTGKAELVGGELVRMTPAGGRHGYAAREILASLREYERQTGRGWAFGDNVGFRVKLPHRHSFSPDAAFYVGAVSFDFLDGAPLFAVEIRSREDYGEGAEARLSAKRADYFAAGTLVVWDVDLEQGQCVRVYRAGEPERATEYRRGDAADAEPALPGWRMAVESLFPREAESHGPSA